MTKNMAIYLLFNNKESKTMWTKRQQANSDPLYAEITIQAGQQDTAIVISGGLLTIVVVERGGLCIYRSSRCCIY